MTDLRGRSLTLDGWKAIAAHVGRSVRSAQRWERDLALPIHRLPTPDGGQLVYARVDEIAAWRSRLESSADAPHVAATPAVPVPVAPETVTASPRAVQSSIASPTPPWFWALCTLTVALSVWAAFNSRSSR